MKICISIITQTLLRYATVWQNILSSIITNGTTRHWITELRQRSTSTDPLYYQLNVIISFTELFSKNELDNNTIQRYIVHLNFHLKLSSQWGTPQGINGSGGNSSPNISWEHESPTLKSGRHARVLLKIKPLPNQEQTIEITNWPDSVLNRRRSFSNININEVSLKADTSISVSEKNPNVKAEKLKYTIPPATTDSSYNHEYTIEFDIQAPKVSNPTMVFLSVFYFYYKTNGGTFYLPYVVIP